MEQTIVVTHELSSKPDLRRISKLFVRQLPKRNLYLPTLTNNIPTDGTHLIKSFSELEADKIGRKGRYVESWLNPIPGFEQSSTNYEFLFVDTPNILES